MGWSFHRSLNLVGVRLDFSKSGIGASVGMKGFRYGVNPNGRRYVRCGMDGIYYQKTLGGGVRNHCNTLSQAQPHLSGIGQQNSASVTHSIESAIASTIVDSTSAGLLEEIQRRMNTPLFHIWAGSLGLVVLFVGASQQMPSVVISGILLALVGFLVGYHFYRSDSTTEIHYDFDLQYKQQYAQLLAGFDQLRRSQRIWQVETTTEVYNAKYHGGASTLQTRTDLNALLGNPAFLRLNRSVPMLVGRKQSLCFLPDMVLVTQGRRIGAVSYYHLSFAWREASFIEGDSPAQDSKQIGATWQFVNKAGGPDRRFANNRQLPILQVAELRFQSTTGLNELIQVSNVQCAAAFVKGLSVLMHGVRSGSKTKAQVTTP